MMDIAAAKIILPEARELSGLASDEFSESFDAARMRAEICIRDGITGEIQPIAILLPDCAYDDRRLLLRAPVLLNAVLTLLDASFAEIRRLRPPEDPRDVERRRRGLPEAGDYAAECAMKCGDRLFRRFLVERYELPDVADAERIAVSVRNILRIKSRAELNTDAGARARWIDFRGSFEAWRRQA